MTTQETAAAIKHDGDKPPISLVPREAIEGVARVLAFGAKKYSPHNWRKGFAWSRLSDATLRHVFAWLDGEDLDPETGLSHIDHAITELMFLREHIAKAYGNDDRHTAPHASERQDEVERLLARVRHFTPT